MWKPKVIRALFYGYTMSIGEIAEAFGVSPLYVEKRLRNVGGR